MPVLDFLWAIAVFALSIGTIVAWIAAITVIWKREWPTVGRVAAIGLMVLMPLVGLAIVGIVDIASRDSLSWVTKAVWSLLLVLTFGFAGIVYFPWMYFRTRTATPEEPSSAPPEAGLAV